MKGRIKGPPLLLCLLLAGALCVTLATGGEPLSYSLPQCPNKVYVEAGTIIDIRGSRQKGAELIEGRREDSLEICIQECCSSKLGCELAVYKTDGYSSAGHNCYLIRCGRLEKCLMVSHQGFVSAVQQTLFQGSRVGE